MLELRTVNFKGQNIEEKLDRLNIYTGPNGAGKSTRLEALQFVITGEIGETKALGDIFKLVAPADADRVYVSYNDEKRFIEREIICDDKGKCTQVLKIDNQPSSAKGACLMFAEHYQKTEDFSIGGFLEKSEQKQLELLMSILPGGPSAAELWKKARAMYPEISENKPLEISASNATGLQFINACCDELNEIKKALQAKKVQYEKSGKTADEEMGKAPTADEIAKLHLQIKNTEDSLKTVTDSLTRLDERAAAKTRAENKKKASQSSIDEAMKQLAAPENNGDLGPTIKECQEKLAKLKSESEGLAAIIRAGTAGAKCPFTGAACDKVDIEKVIAEAEERTDQNIEQMVAVKKALQAVEEQARKQQTEKNRRESWQLTLKAGRTDLAQAEKDLADLAQPADKNELETLRDTANKELLGLRKQRDDIIRRQAEQSMGCNMESKLEDIADEQEKVKAAIKWAQKERLQTLALVIGPLENKINAILQKTNDRFKIEFFRDGKYFLAGANSAMQFAPIKSLSGGERAMYHAAILIGLLETKKTTAKIILIEAAEIDSVNLPKLLGAMENSPASLVMVAYCGDPGKKAISKSWNHAALTVK